jgi:fucose permease
VTDGTGGAAPRLDRDRVTWLVYMQLGLYGYVLYGIGASIQLLRDEQDVSRTVSGLHGTALAVGALVTGLVGARLVRRFGRGAALWGGLTTAVAGVGLFCSSTWLGLTLTGALVATFGGSLVVNSTSTVLADHHGRLGTSAVSEANAMAAGVGTLAPLAVGGAAAAGVGWRAGLLMSGVLLLLVAAAFRGVRVPDHREVADRRSHVVGLSGRYWWAWGVILACVAVEFCMTIWTPDLLESRVGLSEGAAAAGVTAVVGGMAAGRIIGGRLARTIAADRLLLAALATAAVGFFVFWAGTHPVPALAGLVVCGLGISMHFPLGIMRAIGAAASHRDLAAARASLAVGVAVGVGPFALGALSDAVGTHTAFLVVPVLLTLAALGVLGGPSQAQAG